MEKQRTHRKNLKNTNKWAFNKPVIFEALTGSHDVDPCKSDHKIDEVKWNNNHFQSSNQWCRLWKTRYRISDSSVLIVDIKWRKVGKI